MNLSPKHWALLLACVLVLTAIVILGRSDGAKAYAKTSWEYKVVRTDIDRPTGLEDLERGLNLLGADGWEFVHFIHTEGRSETYGQWIFRRPK